MKRIVMLGMIFMLALVSTSFGQITLKGKVIDAKSGKALIGANVRSSRNKYRNRHQQQRRVHSGKIPDGTHTRYEQAIQATRSCLEKVNSNKNDIHSGSTATPVNLNQVVVTGTGTHRRLKDSPVPIEVITGTDLKSAGVNSSSRMPSCY